MKAPLYIVTGFATDPPVVAECPVCFAIVLTARLDDHKRASHG